MKKIVLFTFLIALIWYPKQTNAQIFTVKQDSFYIYPNAPAFVDDTVTVDTASVTILWNVFYTDFPMDWKAISGFCDNYICYPLNTLLDTVLTNRIRTSNPYVAGTPKIFRFYMEPYSGDTLGTHIVRVRLKNSTKSTNIDTLTYIVKFNGISGVSEITQSNAAIVLYPNPANNLLNISWNNSINAIRVEILNMYGTLVSTKIITNNFATININNYPKGVYFVRFFDEQGNLTQTEKFIKN